MREYSVTHFLITAKGRSFSTSIARVREEIEADQLSGAIAGIYDSGVITRVLKLADKQGYNHQRREHQQASGDGTSHT